MCLLILKHDTFLNPVDGIFRTISRDPDRANYFSTKKRDILLVNFIRGPWHIIQTYSKSINKKKKYKTAYLGRAI